MALIHSLSALKLGKQYVALTEKACKKIKILDEQVLSEKDRDKLKQESEANRSKALQWQRKFAENIVGRVGSLNLL